VVKDGEGVLGRIPGGGAETTGPLGKPEDGGKAPGGRAPEVSCELPPIDNGMDPGGALYP
jgi:hypothetical protein